MISMKRGPKARPAHDVLKRDVRPDAEGLVHVNHREYEKLKAAGWSIISMHACGFDPELSLSKAFRGKSAPRIQLTKRDDLFKVDTHQRTAGGIVTSEDVDEFGLRFDYSTSKIAYLEFAAKVQRTPQPLYLSHDTEKPVGKVTSVTLDDHNRRVFVTTRLDDPDTYTKTLTGELRGFSHGIRFRTWTDPHGLKRYTATQIHEISIAKAGANPGARLVMADGTVIGQRVEKRLVPSEVADELFKISHKFPQTMVLRR